MNGLEEAFMTLSVGLKTLAEGISVISKQVDQLADNSASALTKSIAKQTPPKIPTAKKTQSKKIVTKETKTEKPEENRTASDIVYELVKSSNNGANYAYIMEETGFKRKKVANIFFNLKRQGKIKSVGKGVYTLS
jgi:DNA replicative helicase MCM subunit Mcm2 (Cdc46/Mcm family)